jgi:hypothetical protein
MPMRWRRILGIQCAAAGVATAVALAGWGWRHAAGAGYGTLVSLGGAGLLAWRDRHAAAHGAATVAREAGVAFRAAIERLAGMTALLGFGLLIGWFPPAAVLAGFIAGQLAYVVSASARAGRAM